MVAEMARTGSARGMNGEEQPQLEAALSRSRAGLSALTETIPALILIHQGGR
jgi:hypothetical protein